MLFLATVLASPLAMGFNSHVPDAQSTTDWMNGDFESRQRVERQWEFERRVIEVENQRERDHGWQRQISDTIDEMNDADSGWEWQ